MFGKKGKIPKKSLRTRLFILINITIFMVIAICILVNSLIFQRYYLKQKTDMIFDQVKSIETLLNDKKLSQSQLHLELEKLCVNSNTQTMIFDKNNQLIYTSIPENAARFQHSPGIEIYNDENTISVRRNVSVYSKQMDGKEIVVEGKNFVLTSAYIKPLNSQVIELYTATKGDYFVFIQSSMAPIHESVVFSNRFLLIIGSIVWIISAIIVMLIGNKLVKPLRQLSEIAKRIANMDFSQKYKGQTYDEVGMLGESINTMSSMLEKSISELKSANAKLVHDIDQKEKIDKQRKEFMSNVSHELKTPISIIEAYAEGLNEIELDSESRAYYCEVILDEAKKMNILVKKLMSLMRIESGAEELDITRFDITEHINEIIKQKSILIEQSGVSISISNNGPIYVWADDFLIEEVVLNYLTNAIKYCSGEKKIEISIEKINENVRVNVFNTGEKLDDDILENMWRSFYMADKSRNRENGSQGLGLSIVAAIITAHNHKYGAYNTDDGVIFYFELDGDTE